MTVKTIEQAWSKADELMPCDYMHDSIKSANAGYDIYYSTCADKVCWISDLGDRLEVNIPSGESINIWIEAEQTATEPEAVSAEEVAEYVADANAIKNGKYEALYAPEVGQIVTVCISGDSYAAESERAVYAALKHDHESASVDIIERWCDQHGLAWGTISHSQKMHFDHGNGSGHYVVSAFVSARIGHESEFLESCAALLRAKMVQA